MKTFATLFMLIFGLSNFYGQESLQLSIKKDTEAPTTQTEHFYLIEVTNTGKAAITASIAIEHKSCKGTDLDAQSAMRHDVLDRSKSKSLNQISVQPGKTMEFYLKLTRGQNARLDTWNCSDIVARSQEGNIMSNRLTIESFIPNPKNFN